MAEEAELLNFQVDPEPMLDLICEQLVDATELLNQVDSEPPRDLDSVREVSWIFGLMLLGPTADDWLNEVDIAELFQHVEPSAPAFPEEEDEEDGDGDGDGDGDIFETHQICYFEEEKLLVCLRCNIVMTKGFARHLSRVHQETINERAKEELLAICFFSVSMYFQSNRELLSAITWLPVHDDYACLGCAYYCKKKREMKTHCRNAHRVADNFYAVKV